MRPTISASVQRRQEAQGDILPLLSTFHHRPDLARPFLFGNSQYAVEHNPNFQHCSSFCSV